VDIFSNLEQGFISTLVLHQHVQKQGFWIIWQITFPTSTKKDLSIIVAIDLELTIQKGQILWNEWPLSRIYFRIAELTDPKVRNCWRRIDAIGNESFFWKKDCPLTCTKTNRMHAWASISRFSMTIQFHRSCSYILRAPHFKSGTIFPQSTKVNIAVQRPEPPRETLMRTRFEFVHMHRP
jgi:hypothetical protein